MSPTSKHILLLSFKRAGEIRVTDENEFVPKLGLNLLSFQHQMNSCSLKIKTNATNEKSEIIHRSLLTCNGASSILNLNYESCLKDPKISFSEKITHC